MPDQLKQTIAQRRAVQERYERAHARDLPKAERLRRKVELLTKKVKRIKRDRELMQRNPERTRISVNHSSRGGLDPRLIVLHITVSHNRPGLGDIDAILNFFDQTSTDASSHIINDREGHDARCVFDRDKAWTQAAYNPVALSIEQIEFSAGRTRQQWLTESKKQLDNTAAWIAFWSHKYDIPIQHSTKIGVCEHRDLGSAGGGHSDCGTGYPMDYVLERARQLRKAKYGR